MNKNMKILAIVGVVIVIALVIFFSTRTKTIKTSDGQATISQDSNTVTVNTNAGSLQAGDNVSLPASFPSDVYVIDGDLKAALQLTQNNGYSASVETTESVATVKADYVSHIESDGWTIQQTLDLPIGTSIFAEKDSRSLSVSITETDGKTAVAVTVSDTEE